MSDNTSIEDTKTPDDSTLDKDSIIEDLKKQHEAMKAKMEELLAETKASKQKARDEARAKEQAKLEKAKKDGDYEQLLKSSEKERETLRQQLEQLTNKVSAERLKSESMRIATDLADGPNAEILSEFIQRRLKYTDDGIKVIDSNGELTVSSIDALKSEFANSDKYKSLLRGNKSSGGSAQGGGNGVPATKQVDRKTFDSWDQAKRMDFIVKQKGIVVDNIN